MSWSRTNTGLYIPYQKRPYPVAIDFFCGAGGMSLGTIQAGFEVVAAFDSSPEAALTYTVNLGNYPMQFHFATPEDGERMEKLLNDGLKSQKAKVKKLHVTGSGWRASELTRGNYYPGVSHFFLGDVRKWSPEQVLEIIGFERGEVDLVMGGPPCQGFSKAGKQNVMDPRNSLVFDFARFVVGISAKMMVFENVPGIANMVTPEGVNVIDAFTRILEDGGFGGYNALKKQLESNPNARAAMRGKRRKGSDDNEPAGSKPEPAQLSLF